MISKRTLLKLNWGFKQPQPQNPRKRLTGVWKGSALFMCVLSQTLLACSWGHDRKGSMLYIYESTVGLPVNFQVPPLTELYTVMTGRRPTGEWSGLRTDAIHLPHSSDGFQARDERIIRRSHHAWRLHALLCKAMNYRCLKSNRMHMRGALGSQTRRQRSGARKQPDSNPVEWKTVKVQRQQSVEVTKQLHGKLYA